MMVQIFVLVLVLLMAAPAIAAGKPNILVIVADDLGVNDLSFHPARPKGTKGPPIETPNIDRIARQGVAYTNAYASNATCAPSRAALMTGRYQHRVGFEFNPGAAGALQGITRADWFGIPPNIFPNLAKDMPPPDEIGLDTGEITLGQMLGAAGYRTAAFGKWHLGSAPRFRPENRGFDHFVGHYGALSLFAPVDDPNVVNAPLPFDGIFWPSFRYEAFENGRPLVTTQYQTDLWADEAIKFIRSNKSRPFFVYLAFNAPHNPLQAPRDIYDELVHIERHEERVYYAMVVAMDRAIGRVLQALKAEGVAENTLILFTSDHGGASALTQVWSHNLPYRGEKGSFWNGGLRVPLFICLPEKFDGGRVIDGTVSLLDLFPTLADVAGVQPPADRPMDGISLTANARGKAARTLFFRAGHLHAVTDGRMKLIVSARPDRAWLYDLRRDPYERRNIAARRPAEVARLQRLVSDHFALMEQPRFPALFELAIPADPWPKGLSPEELLHRDHVFFPG